MYDDIDLRFYENRAFKRGVIVGATSMFLICLFLGLTVT